MEDRKYLPLDSLIVWSDNPRHGLQTGIEDFSEIEVINILIEVVGSDKMYNLIADIFASKKLMGNVNPVVVPSGEKYYVYDGNRRISALKILKNPAIVEDEALRGRIIRLINDEDVSFVDNVFVYITDEAEAFEIMDKTHSGEQQGVGMISWEPYQRDTSLSRRGKSLQYPYAFSVCQALGYTMKSFGKIAYTDIDRLFGSKPLRDYFLVDESTADYPTKAEYIIGMLLKYKSEKGFRSFSRQFNASGSTDPDAPIAAFCQWVGEQERNKKNFYFTTFSVEVFVDQPFSFDMLHLQINDASKREIEYGKGDISVEYISPNGIRCSEISNSEIGDWQVEIVYEGEKHVEKVSIMQLLSPKIDFDTKKLFGHGNTIDLRKLVIRATDGHGQNRIDDLTITSVGEAEIIRDVFTVANPVGTYQIAYAFTDITGAPFSTTKEIRIVDKTNPLLAENRTAPLLSFNGVSTLIDISEVVNKLVSEINSLTFENYICVVATSLRALVELSFDELHTKGIITFTNKGNLEKCIEEFKDYLLAGELSRLCTTYNTELPSYNNEKNCVEQLEPSTLSSYLNLATHKSITRIDITKMAEIARKAIAPILVYTSLIIR